MFYSCAEDLRKRVLFKEKRVCEGLLGAFLGYFNRFYAFVFAHLDAGIFCVGVYGFCDAFKHACGDVVADRF